MILLRRLGCCIMGWVWQRCVDPYGGCIRQYVVLGLSIVILCLAVYSCLRTYQLYRQFTYELLPLAINSLTLLILVGLYSRLEVFNTSIILLIIQLYTYFLIAYGFLFAVQKNNPSPRRDATLKILKYIFGVVTGVCLLAALTVTGLSIASIITCKDDQGLGSLILMILELPLLLLSYKYGNQAGDQGLQREHMISEGAETPLVENKFIFLRKKKGQLLLVKVAFLVSLALHVVEMVCYYLGEDNIMCHGDSNLITVTGPMELFIMCIESLSQLFPHFIIPFIFWYFPYKAAAAANQTVFFNSHQSDTPFFTPNGHQDNSKLFQNDVNNEQQIRQIRPQNRLSNF